MHKLGSKLARLLHVLSPAAQLFEMMINTRVGGEQRLLGARTARHGPNVVLIDEVMDQVVPEPYQIFEIRLGPLEVLSAHFKPELHPNRRRLSRIRIGQVGVATRAMDQIGPYKFPDQEP